jgi:hypothetical protein
LQHCPTAQQRRLAGRSLRIALRSMFANSTARAWWGEVASGWIITGSRRERSFLQVVNDEYGTAESEAAKPLEDN